jgi:hypothetical protein
MSDDGKLKNNKAEFLKNNTLTKFVDEIPPDSAGFPAENPNKNCRKLSCGNVGDLNGAYQHCLFKKLKYNIWNCKGGDDNSNRELSLGLKQNSILFLFNSFFEGPLAC